MFSDKYGYKAEKTIQFECISDILRRRVWNLFYQYEIHESGIYSKRTFDSLTGKPTIECVVADKLGIVIDGTSGNETPQEKLKEFLLSKCEWYEVYDFIDVHLSVIDETEKRARAKQYNTLLDEENSGYRIVSGRVAPITNACEIQVIEEAASSPFQSVNEHLQKALDLFCDIKKPDYENSIKESICAVEAMCCIITGQNGANATLGKTIKKLKESGVHIHSAMESAFSSLYGYTSDENGIRHGGMDFANAPSEDAKYMLVTCSAFINYLIEKWNKVKA